jgi:peptidoglycan/LPS O-acetylase OafA/YrhL
MTAPVGPPATSAPQHLAPLDGYRALAAVLIVICHAVLGSGAVNTVPTLDANRASFFGVVMFFALSGYLLYEPIVAAHLEGRPTLSTRRFLWRRLLRILPLYWIVLTAYLLILDTPGIGSVANHVKMYLLLQIYDSSLYAKGIPAAWTLCVDLTFYLALPFLALAARRLGRRWGGGPNAMFQANAVMIAAVFLLGPIWRVSWSLSGHDQLVNIWLPAQADLFALGMALALVNAARRCSDRPVPSGLAAVSRRPAACLVGAVAAIAVLDLVQIPLSGQPVDAGQQATRYAMYLVAGALLLAPMVLGDRRNRPARFLGSPPLRWLSDASYGLYLWHMIVLFQVRELMGGPGEVGFWPLFPIGLVISLALGACGFELIEKPLHQLRDGRRHRRAPARPPAAARAVVSRR